MNKPIVFFDCETSGTDTSKDRIVQLASIKLNSDFTATDSEIKDILLNPGMQIPAGATLVHGITDEMVQGKPMFKQIAKSLYEYLDGCDYAGHNILQFDVPMLSEEFARCGITWPSPEACFIDSFKIMGNKIPRTLEGAYNFYCNGTIDGAHNAAIDIQATIKIVKAQIERYPDLRDMTSAELSRYCIGEDAVDIAGKLILIEGKICYAFGKDKGKSVVEHPGFANWMLKQSFPTQTLNIIKGLLNNK